MGKKRKSTGTNLDEVDRTIYASFCSAANSLSLLYSQSINHHKLSFFAGERHSLEKLYQWILRQQEAGSRVATIDILNYIQNELDYSGDELPIPPQAPVQQHTHSQAPSPITNNSFLVSGSSTAQTNATLGLRSEQVENQTKNIVFSNALSSPIRRSLQHYHLSQGGNYPTNGALPPGDVAETNETSFSNQQNRESNSNDTSMDMHQDSPGPESNY